MEAMALYLVGLSYLECMLLNVEFKLYAIRHPHKRKRLADLLWPMRLRMLHLGDQPIAPAIGRRPASATNFIADCGVMDRLLLMGFV